MSRPSGDLGVADGAGETDPDTLSEGTVSPDTPVPDALVALVSEFWLTGVLAVSVLVLLLAFTVDADPGVRFAIGALVFAVWMWWFVSTGVAILRD